MPRPAGNGGQGISLQSATMNTHDEPLDHPDYTLRIVPDETLGCVRIEAVNRYGQPEYHVWCTEAQARAFAPILAAY